MFLLVMHHVPVERCATILEAVTGERPSDGRVHSLLERAARAVRGACLLIRALAVTAGVVCADETPVRVGPGPKTRKKYLLVACTRLLTCYFLGDRSLASFDGFVMGDLSGSVAVHDRYRNYDACDGIAHQLRCARLLRDPAGAAEQYPDAIWPGQAAGALRALDGTTLTMTWSYGAAVAVTAAFASLAAAVAALVITSAGAKARRADAVTGRSRPPAAQT